MTVMAFPRTFEALPTFARPTLVEPTNRERRKHRAEHSTDDGFWTPAVDFLASLLTMAVIAARMNRAPQIDSEPTEEVPQVGAKPPVLEGTVLAIKALTDAFKVLGSMPPKAPEGWRGWPQRIREWFAAWRDNDVAADRLFMVREWCKTIMLMAGTATFLYVCWTLVDWIPV